MTITSVLYLRLTPSQRKTLEGIAAARHITLSTTLRYLIVVAPIPYLTGDDIEYTAVVDDCPFIFGDYNALSVELIRQRTNANQIYDGFEKFCNNNAVYRYIEDQNERFQELPDLIQRTLFEILTIVDSAEALIDKVSSLVNLDQTKALYVEIIGARLEPFYVNILDAKAEMFDMNRGEYIRFVLTRYRESREFKSVIDDSKRVFDGSMRGAFFAVETFDIDEITEGFNRCGKILNDAAHYVNERMSTHVYSTFDNMGLAMETFLGKLEVALAQYRAFEQEHLSFKVGGAR